MGPELTDPEHNGGWQFKVEENTVDNSGTEPLVHIVASVIAPVPIAGPGYELFPGLGYYKLQTAGKTWEEAVVTCAREGAHLAIINSEAESDVIKQLFARYPSLGGPNVAAFIGFHDKYVEGQYVTLFDEPLSSTGFVRWSNIGKQPDDAGGREDCGSVHRNGGLNDLNCDSKAPFFCEQELFAPSNIDEYRQGKINGSLVILPTDIKGNAGTGISVTSGSTPAGGGIEVGVKEGEDKTTVGDVIEPMKPDGAVSTAEGGDLGESKPVAPSESETGGIKEDGSKPQVGEVEDEVGAGGVKEVEGKPMTGGESGTGGIKEDESKPHVGQVEGEVSTGGVKEGEGKPVTGGESETGGIKEDESKPQVGPGESEVGSDGVKESEGKPQSGVTTGEHTSSEGEKEGVEKPQTGEKEGEIDTGVSGEIKPEIGEATTTVQSVKETVEQPPTGVKESEIKPTVVSEKTTDDPDKIYFLDLDVPAE